MKLRRLLAVARKEFLHVLRDPWSLGMAIGLPLVMLVLFGYALTLDVDRVPLAAWDQSNTQASRELISRFAGSRYFAVSSYATDYRQLERAIDTRQALAGLVIPVDFARDLDAGRGSAVQFIVDGSDSNTATIALGYADALVQGYSRELVVRQQLRLSGQTLRPPLEVRPRVWFNPDMQSKNYIVPGLIAVIMMVIAALLTSLTVAREWERGTMEQLVSTPVKPAELILGKLVPYFVIALGDVALAALLGVLAFGVPLRGSAAVLFAFSSVFLVGTLSAGVLVSVATRSQLVASQMAMVLTFVPSFLLSGFMYPIENMPRFVQAVTYVVPARYFVHALKGLFLKGVGPHVLWLDGLLLTGFASVMVTLAVMRFRKKLG